MAIPNVSQTVQQATTAPCPACRINEILRDAIQNGGWTKAGNLKKSKQVRQAYVHKCGK